MESFLKKFLLPKQQSPTVCARNTNRCTKSVLFFPGLLGGRRTGARTCTPCTTTRLSRPSFTSSLYAFGTVDTLVASRLTRRVGRQAIMLIGGSMFLVCVLINAAAANLAMLIVGRTLLGMGLSR